jgi:hypothetical protein
MTYRITLECGLTGLADDVAYRHLLRQAVRAGNPTTRVRGGYVVTLTGGHMVALIKEAPSND